MKRLILTLLLSITVISSFAFKFRDVYLSARFGAYQYDDQYYLVLLFKPYEDCNQNANTIVKFKLNDVSVLKFNERER